MAYDIVRHMKTSAPALMPLFRSETQLRIVALLFGGEAELQVRDVAEAVGVPGPTASRELARLERHGLVTSRVLGRSRLYSANWDLPWAKELASIMTQTVGVLAALSRALAGVDGVDEAWIFGSWAARYGGEAGPWPRDVDVAVVGEPDRLALMRAARAAEAGLRIDVNTTVIDRATWDDPEPDSFTAQIKARPLVRVPLG